jgi:hypothetical protein
MPEKDEDRVNPADARRKNKAAFDRYVDTHEKAAKAFRKKSADDSEWHNPGE